MTRSTSGSTCSGTACSNRRSTSCGSRGGWFVTSGQIDGAGGWAQFRHITMPLLSPTTFFLSMVAVIGTFTAFNHIYIMRLPGARGTIDTASIVIFDAFFKSGQAGYASAMALVLFGVILSLTLAQHRVLRKRVFYG